MEFQLVGHLGEPGQIQPFASVGSAASVPQLKIGHRGVLDIGQGTAVSVRDVEKTVFPDGGEPLPVVHLRDAEGEVFLVPDVPEKVHVVDVRAVDLKIPELGELDHLSDVPQGKDFVHDQLLQSA